MTRYSTTEYEGINAVERLVLKELGWIFRIQPIADMGIDAHLESVEEGNPTGKLLGVQIKSGSSHFVIKDEELVYYGSITHLNYWISHSLPVILVAHLPETNETFWEYITNDTIKRTRKGWKIGIPKSQKLGKSSKRELSKALEGSDREIRTRNLFLHVESMRYLERGGRLVIYKEEWLHKSLGRGVMNLIQINPDGSEVILKEDNFLYVGYSTQQLVETVYPWASVSIDEKFYEQNFSDSFYEIFSDKYKEMNPVYPYKVYKGEVGAYRLELKLNTLGKSFLEVFKYLEDDKKKTAPTS